MIPGLYFAVLTFSLGAIYLYFRGRTVEGVVRRPPEGSDLKLVVGNLSYIEHELIKHRVPVIRSLLGKGRWSEDDWDLLARTLGAGEASLVAELDGYLGGIQRGAGRTLVNFTRDRAFNHARRQVQVIQKTGDRWARERRKPSPEQHERTRVELAASWLAGDFRKYLLELRRSVFRCHVTTATLEGSSRRGLMEAGKNSELTVDPPREDCIAHILPSDLDLVIRNLVRNATQASHSSDLDAELHIEVEEVCEETGEESLLIRVHDNCPQMLTREQIYGREATRGLGLVTTALNRYQGAVRCIPSSREAMVKAMEVRLQRSLHEPDDAARTIGKPRTLSMVLPVAFVLFHALVIGTVMTEYFADYPIETIRISLPDHCAMERRTAKDASIVCETLNDTRELRDGPTELRITGEVSNGLSSSLSGDDCLDARLDSSSLVIDISKCLNDGHLTPSTSLELSSPLVNRDVVLAISFRSTVAQLLEAAQSALHGNDFESAGTILTFLSGDGAPALNREEAMEVRYWKGLRLVLIGQSLPRVGPRESEALRCRLAEEAAGVVAFLNGTNWREDQQVASLHTRASYLDAIAHLWLRGDPISAALRLRGIAEIEPADRAVQSARLLLMLLGAMELGDVSKAEVVDNLFRLDHSYRNPAVVAAGHSAELVLELPGVWLDIPIPEALCTFDRAFPDLDSGPLAETLLREVCDLRRPHPRVDREVREIVDSLRDLGPILVCD